MDPLTPAGAATAIIPKPRPSEEGAAAFHGLMEPRAEPAVPPPAPAAPVAPQGLSPLGAACAAAAGIASPEAIEKVAQALRDDPTAAKAARIERGPHGLPMDGLPALAAAALQGADPLGWVDVLLDFGVDFDAANARAQARFELLETPAARAGHLSDLNRRCDALSIWTVACAKAEHPEQALRAVARVRLARPAGLAPLLSELAKFETDPAWDDPSLGSQSRARAFVEAGWENEGFLGATLPSWILGPRGGDLAPLADEVARRATPDQAQTLYSALLASPQESAASEAFKKALEPRLAETAQAGPSAPRQDPSVEG